MPTNSQEYQQKWYEKNKAKKLAQNSEWQKRNKEKRAEHHRKWRATSRGAYTELRIAARTRKLEMTLEFEDFEKAFTSPCSYCGSKPKRVGIDRVDRTKGYLPDNIVPACWPCNDMKGKWTTEEFLEQVEKIHEFQNRNL